ncbi:hypothetical protein RU07_16095 [Agrobacterium tumefaciens]|uniref:Uncharacterized protein n=2 Tax=Agrobacterium TaxID=357 RepID=A0A0D0J631_AGRTU|nr:hypothetical protein [Agrobacterium rosae]KIQ01105.1 hypothetical protein RU07_16095 [Agrobacterium tumefaciens]SCX34143.1 hypothetical protein DSM25559_4393 [Agrobacterium rosae]
MLSPVEVEKQQKTEPENVYETRGYSNRVGAGGLFSVIDVLDVNENKITGALELNDRFFALESLRGQIAKQLRVSALDLDLDIEEQLAKKPRSRPERVARNLFGQLQKRRQQALTRVNATASIKSWRGPFVLFVPWIAQPIFIAQPIKRL